MLDELMKTIHVDKDGIPRISSNSIETLDKIKDAIINYFVGDLVREAESWLMHVKEEVSRLARNLDLRGFTYPREFNSFISDPKAHLRKKLFNYVYDLIRKRIDIDEFIRKASTAIRTSLRTNMRTAYQIWCITCLMNILHEDLGYDLEFPEHRFLNFDRSGKQRLGIIPPNVVLVNYKKGYLSFFHEAPRPLGWEDTSDLQRIWGLYTALRPDLLVYGGKILNIVDLSLSPPIKRPDIIIEFKELPDWFLRTRDLKGYFKKPLTAEEWRSKWLEGLFDGLADIMGVKRTEVRQRVESGASLRVREYKLIQLYASTYKPKLTILVSKHCMPNDVKRDLEVHGVKVVDCVEFNRDALMSVAKVLDQVATYGDVNRVSITINAKTLRKVMDVCKNIGLTKIDLCLERLASTFANRDDAR